MGKVDNSTCFYRNSLKRLFNSHMYGLYVPVYVNTGVYTIVKYYGGLGYALVRFLSWLGFPFRLEISFRLEILSGLRSFPAWIPFQLVILLV
jgi:hypothetical protein